MSRMKSLAMGILAMAAMAQNENEIFSEQSPKKCMRFNPNYKPNPKNKTLREFSINGRKVMAYSRKDAITRLKHNK